LSIEAIPTWKTYPALDRLGLVPCWMLEEVLVDVWHLEHMMQEQFGSRRMIRLL
jgi:hypothetical protein